MKFYPSNASIWGLWSVSTDHSKYHNDFRFFEASYYLENQELYYLTDSEIKYYQSVVKYFKTNEVIPRHGYSFDNCILPKNKGV